MKFISRLLLFSLFATFCFFYCGYDVSLAADKDIAKQEIKEKKKLWKKRRGIFIRETYGSLNEHIILQIKQERGNRKELEALDSIIDEYLFRFPELLNPKSKHTRKPEIDLKQTSIQLKRILKKFD